VQEGTPHSSHTTHTPFPRALLHLSKAATLEELHTELFNKLNANYNITGKTTTFDGILHGTKWLHPMAITVSCV